MVSVPMVGQGLGQIRDPMTRPLLLALLLAGCTPWTNSHDPGRTWTKLDSCLIRARAIAEGAPRLVTRAEAERWCREDGR